ncbi:MAG: zeta toxin family protein [Candidatus Cloacimonetes bacterium]|nr:zeta toxin family protein [Candidatus Cloacimonadota bacterium]
MDNKLIVVIGSYGSGKSEYSINLAKEFSDQGNSVTLVDLDVVNPYFRSRDVREQFRQEGITVIAPEGEFQHADLPMLSPRIMGAVQNKKSNIILDVGGDPAGCRTLARYVENIKKRGYEMHFVINTKRPFTSDLNGILEMLQMLRSASKLEVTELICNTNLMEFTTMDILKMGIELIDLVAEHEKIKFDTFTVLESNLTKIPEHIMGKTRKKLKYFLSKPWEMQNKVHHPGI